MVLTLETVDADIDLSTQTELYIISGNPTLQFHVRQTGEIYVAKALDREKIEHYNLEVLITDGLFTDVTKVHITILDVNGKFSSFKN